MAIARCQPVTKMASLRSGLLLALCACMAAGYVESCGTCNGGGYGGGGGGGGGGGKPPATPPVKKPGGGGGGGATTCPLNLVKLKVCSALLGGTVGPDCCPLLNLLGADVEICLCLALDVNVLGLININISRLDLIASIMTSCGLTPNPNFSCPP